jgi:DNA-binding NtrC family response regulator
MKNIPWERLAALPTLQAREDRYYRRVMTLCDFDADKAAAVLGVARATIYRRVRELGIETARERRIREREEQASKVEALAARRVAP